MDIRLLGPVEIHGELGVARPARAGERCVLAALAFSPGRPVRVTTLVDHIWTSAEQSDRSLQTITNYVRKVRTALKRAGGQAEWLRSDRSSRAYVLEIDPTWVDYHRFTQQTSAALQLRDSTQLPDAIHTCQQALTLWRGPALADVTGHWADSRRHALETERQAAYDILLTEQLRAGQHTQVARTVTDLIEEVTPTDRLLLLGAQALAGCGQHTSIPALLTRTTQRMHEIADAAPSRETLKLIDQLTAQPTATTLDITYAIPAEALSGVCPESAVSQVCPYLGLEPFTAQHADWFHGREAATESVLAALGRHRRMLMLLGPSGAGKSSLIKAGVLPALAQGAIPGSDRWLPLLARPGQDLLTELDGAGLPGATTDGLLTAVERRLATESGHDRLLLVIDQFEELLTQPTPTTDDRPSDQRLTAADQLVELSGSHAAVTVVLIMRNDFYASLDAIAPDLMNAALPGLLNVPATLSVPELKAIITRPAEAVDLSIETGLVDRIISDILDADPAARQAPVTLLPPLELALRQLWIRRRRDDSRLTHAAYEKIGKVTGSMTAWCNTAISQLPADHRPTAQRILTALVRPADEPNSFPATRQPVTLTRLRALATDPQLVGQADDSAFDAVLTALTRYRIITTGMTTAPPHAALGEPTAELIHDALIRDWNDLRDWLAQDHQFQLWLHRTAEQQARHTQSGLPGDLLNGTLLAEGIDWADQRTLPDDITAILTASRQHQQSAVRRTRRINTILAGMLALALIATGVAVYQQRTATTAQHEAQSRQLAAQSTNLQSHEPDLASLLAVKAWKTSHTKEATAALYTAPATHLRNRLTGHKASARSVAFSSDGKTLATGSVDGSVRLWNVETGKVRTALKDNNSSVVSVAFSPDGETLAVGGMGGSACLWNVETGKVCTALKDYGDYVKSVAFSSDGKTLATGSVDGSVRLWNVETGKVRTALKDNNSSVVSVAFSPDGKTLATGSDDGSASLWNVVTGKVRVTLKIHETSVVSVAFSPDGKTLATGSDDGSARLSNVVTGKVRTNLKYNNAYVKSVAFSPDGETLATGSVDGSVRLWNVETGKVRTALKDNNSSVVSVAFSPDGETLATGGMDGFARLWGVGTVKPRVTLKDNDADVESVAFSPDGETLATGSVDGSARLWDEGTGKPRRLFKIHNVAVESVAFRPGGKTLATGSDDGSARLWNVETGKVRTTLKDYDAAVVSVAFSPDGKTLATGSDDGSARLWNVETGKVRTTLKDYDAAVVSVAFSPDGKTLATGSVDGSARLWDVYTGKVRATLKGHDAAVESVAFYAKTLATGSVDGSARLWDVYTGKVRTTLKDNDATVESVAFSPDGKTLATGADGTVRLWDVNIGTVRATLGGYDTYVKSMAFSSDGKTLATGADGTVRLWDVNLPDAQEISDSICESIHRNFTRTEQAMYLHAQSSDPVCPRSPAD